MSLVNTNSKWFTDMTAQFAHFFAGVALVENLTLFHHPVIGMVGFLVYAGVKEFVIDKYIEGQPFADNMTDFSFYSIGAGVGLVLGLWH